MEGKNREKFVRLAGKRVNSAIKTIRLIGNLSNRNNYTYNKSDVDKIFRAIDTEIRHAKARFRQGTITQGEEFKLD